MGRRRCHGDFDSEVPIGWCPQCNAWMTKTVEDNRFDAHAPSCRVNGKLVQGSGFYGSIDVVNECSECGTATLEAEGEG